MKSGVKGIHHITSVSGKAAENFHFYTQVLGLRLVKKTVNFDDPGVYHLYYGDRTGSPGTLMTFFPYGGPRARKGAGQVAASQHVATSWLYAASSSAEASSTKSQVAPKQ